MRQPDVEQSDRFVSSSTAWTGDTCIRDTDVHAQRFSAALSHLLGHLRADRSVFTDGGRLHASQLYLSLVAVGGDRAEVIIRAAGDVGYPMRYQPAGGG